MENKPASLLAGADPESFGGEDVIMNQVEC